MTALFAFDFDGVLFDTARECLEISYQTVRALHRRGDPRFAFAAPWAALEAPPAELATAFARSRYLVGPPWQYAVLLACLTTGTLPPTTTGFLAVCAERRASLADFTDAYFAQRAEVAADPRWATWATPYAASVRAFRALHARGAAVILSTRDARSITTLCAHHLEIALDGASLLPRAGEREKWELLLEAAAQRGLPPARVWFLDDYVHHALPAHQRGIRAHLASWGYLGPADLDDARSAGLPTCALDTLDATITAFTRDHEELRS